MRLFRLFWGIMLVAACLAATVSASAPPGGGGAENSIAISTIDVSTTKKSANIAGTCTTQDATTTLTTIGNVTTTP